MHLSRYFVANTVILVIVAGSMFDIIRDEEHWPFSQYPMFNRVTNSRELKWLRLYGVTQNGEEIALIRYKDVFPFDQSRLSKALGSIRAREEPAQIETALVNCLDRYERLRQRGWHHGPQLSRMRLYEVQWTLDPRATNVHSPESRRLLGDVGR